MRHIVKHFKRTGKLWIAALIAASATLEPTLDMPEQQKTEQVPLVNIKDFSSKQAFFSLSDHAPDISIDDKTSIFSLPGKLKEKGITRDTCYIHITTDHPSSVDHTIAFHQKYLQKLIDASKNFQHRLGIKGNINLTFSMYDKKMFYGINFPSRKTGEKEFNVVLDSRFVSQADQQQILFVLGHEMGHIADYHKRHNFSSHEREYRADSAGTVLTNQQAGKRFVDKIIQNDDAQFALIFSKRPPVHFMSPIFRKEFSKNLHAKRNHPSGLDRMQHIEKVAKGYSGWLER